MFHQVEGSRVRRPPPASVATITMVFLLLILWRAHARIVPHGVV